MTLEQKIALLLPKKKTCHRYFRYDKILINHTIDQCATNLKQEFEEGKICFVSSEEELEELIIANNYSKADTLGNRINNLAKAIISLLTKGKDNASKN